jgi:hypothetical protein
MKPKIDEIMQALFGRAVVMEFVGPQMPVALPEQAPQFVPPADGKYLDVTFFPNVPRWEGITNGIMEQGLLQVMVVWPRALGIVAPGRKAELVKAHFPKSLVLLSGTTRVSISREPVAAQPLVEPDKVSVPVTISWTA